MYRHCVKQCLTSVQWKLNYREHIIEAAEQLWQWNVHLKVDGGGWSLENTEPPSHTYCDVASCKLFRIFLELTKSKLKYILCWFLSMHSRETCPRVQSKHCGRAGGIAQVVHHLLCKWTALTSNSNITKNFVRNWCPHCGVNLCCLCLTVDHFNLKGKEFYLCHRAHKQLFFVKKWNS
jgi:hypothetical protein